MYQVEEVNSKERDLITSLIKQPNHPKEQYEFWKEDLEEIKANPKAYWDRFCVDGSSNERSNEIRYMKKYYNEQ